jgi:hypothetical protein
VRRAAAAVPAEQVEATRLAALAVVAAAALILAVTGVRAALAAR